MEPTAAAPTAASQAHKTYVFVDEYNRHKRLKVMRACDGCRKRKIRCDGALQNGPWPCGACVRLKLKCIPPTLDGDDEAAEQDGADKSSQFTFRPPSPPSPSQLGESPPPSNMTSTWNSVVPRAATLPTQGPTSAPAPAVMRPDEDPYMYSSRNLLRPQHLPRVDTAFSNHGRLISSPVSSQSHHSHQWDGPLGSFPTQTLASNAPGASPEEVHAKAKQLSSQMGDLAIEITSVANYIQKEKQLLAETPVVEEPEVELPVSVNIDSTIRIPPEMMPHEERAMDYFGYFFTYIHPYAPVLHREMFYEQWQNDRQSISPLVLEGIFACVAHYLDPEIEMRRWLALAARHEESFKDVPRLSTIQGLLLLTKAREGVSKRGYYYRSWMSVKYMVAMAMDLGLNEHHAAHAAGTTCKFDRSECMVRTRVWHLLFMLEGWLGGAQGRSDYTIDLDMIDFSLPDPSSELSDFEYQTSRRFAYCTQLSGIIKQSNNMWQTFGKVNKDWALNPRFVQHNEEIQAYMGKLPADMQIDFPNDESAPPLRGKHFVAFVHIYQNLVVIMHHRPQLQTLLERKDPAFQKHLAICNESATKICRLQEALHRDFGIHGLHFMQRGIGFNIYCILTCTMLHLATITSPDAATRSRARRFFTRHMRMLEHCIPGATLEIKPQIEALRQAFSQDTSKPFELKADIGRRSSSQEPSHSHAQDIRSQAGQGPMAESWSGLLEPPSARTLSNASTYSQSFDAVSPHAMNMPSSNFVATTSAAPYVPITIPQQVASTPQPGYTLSSDHTPSPGWDPSTIFQQWNAAFSTAAPPPQVPSQGPPAQGPPPHHPQPSQAPQQLPTPPHMPVAIQQQASSFPPQPRVVTSSQPIFYPPPRPSNAPATTMLDPTSPLGNMPPSAAAAGAVAPGMWQDAFNPAFVSGQGRKRYRQEGGSAGGGGGVDFGTYDGLQQDRKGWQNMAVRYMHSLNNFRK